MRRLVRRTKDAFECSRTSSALSTVVSVRRGRRFSWPVGRAGLGGGAGRAGLPGAGHGELPLPRLERGGAGRKLAGQLRLGLGLAEALLGLQLALLFGFLLVTAAFVVLALAGFGGRAFGALDGIACLANLRLFQSDLAFFRLTQAGVGQRMGAGLALLLGQRRQDEAGRRLRRGRDLGRNGGWRCRARHGAGLGGPPGCRRRRGRGFDSGLSRRSAFDFFDHHLLGAAMAETLANDAVLDAAAL